MDAAPSRRSSSRSTLSLKERSALIGSHLCFAKLPPDEIKQLAALSTERTISINHNIVTEDELVDSVYFIIKGKAEVKHQTAPVATLGPGEAIGLNETGFYSATGKRTATITAISKTIVLQLDINVFNQLTQKNSHLDTAMREQAGLLQRMNLIKHAAPFEKLNTDNLKWLAKQTLELSVSKGQTIFKQGDSGDYCYLIQSGEVKISTISKNNKETQLALLKSNMIFGEMSLILNAERNAFAYAITDCKLLVLSRNALTEATQKKLDVGKSLMTLTRMRVRPARHDHIEIFSYRADDGETVITLKDTINYNYFRLSEEGLYLWNRINGKRTVHDLALDYYKRFNDHDPAMISGFITELMEGGFIIVDPPILGNLNDQPLSRKILLSISKIFEASYSFNHVDKWVTRQYQHWAKWIYTSYVLSIFMTISIIGFIVFLYNFNRYISLLQTTPHIGRMLLVIIPIGMGGTILHELAHAFTTKYFGREVKNFGVGWYWLGPIAFCDTSDMWLSPRHQRVYVDIAGMFCDSVIAGIAILCTFLVASSYTQVFLWFFALLSYISILRNLTPFIELDGYYTLNDLTNRENLRLDAITWLIDNYANIIKDPSILFQRKMEVIFWWLSSFFMIVEITTSYLISKYLLSGLFGIKNPLVSFIIFMIVVILSSMTLLAEIKKEV